MKENDNSFESYMRDDMKKEIENLKDVVMNMTEVMEFGFQQFSLVDKEKVPSQKALGFIGVSAYVMGHINDELGIILEELSTV